MKRLEKHSYKHVHGQLLLLDCVLQIHFMDYKTSCHLHTLTMETLCSKPPQSVSLLSQSLVLVF